MLDRQLRTVQDVAAWRLCTGCGACKYACNNKAVKLVNIPDQGILPIVYMNKCEQCGECIQVCPGIELAQTSFRGEIIHELKQSWGPVLEVWEGYATDDDIRFEASSGGAATALALFCLEKENSSGVLHIGASPKNPTRNVPVFSKNRADLLACAGSRYSPATPCEKLDWIQKAESSCVFIGKPCDIAALRKSQAVNPKLNNKVDLAISIFCAGTPTTNATDNLLNVLGIKPEEAEGLRYRGHGWPGMTTVKVKGSKQTYQMTYNEAWGGILSKKVQMRCRLCPDGTGEFADISCGDPWYREACYDEPGRSLVLVRTVIGQKLLHRAIELDYVKLTKVEPRILSLSQRSLLQKRRNIWGRVLTIRLMLIPAPKYIGFSLFKNWLRLTAVEKLRSLGGTLKRIMLHGWMKPLQVIIPNNEFQRANDVDTSVVDSSSIET